MWDNRLADVTGANDLPSLLREELERFFLNVTLFYGEERVRIDGWRREGNSSPVRLLIVVDN